MEERRVSDDLQADIARLLDHFGVKQNPWGLPLDLTDRLPEGFFEENLAPSGTVGRERQETMLRYAAEEIRRKQKGR